LANWGNFDVHFKFQQSFLSISISSLLHLFMFVTAAVMRGQSFPLAAVFFFP
jgi:hypothetical protein